MEPVHFLRPGHWTHPTQHCGAATMDALRLAIPLNVEFLSNRGRQHQVHQPHIDVQLKPLWHIAPQKKTRSPSIEARHGRLTHDIETGTTRQSHGNIG